MPIRSVVCRFTVLTILVNIACSVPLSAQRADSLPKDARQGEVFHYLAEAAKSEADVTGGSPLLAWLRSSTAASTLSSPLGDAPSGAGLPRREGTGFVTMQRSVSGDSTIYTLSVDSVAKRVEGGWLFDAASPINSLVSIWDKRGMPLDDSTQTDEAATPPPDRRTLVLMEAAVGILAMFPPHLPGKSAPTVWADTIDTEMDDPLRGSPGDRADIPWKMSMRVVRTWRLWQGDTLAVEFDATLSQQTFQDVDGTVVTVEVKNHAEAAMLISLDSIQRFRSGVAIIRERTKSGSR